MRPIPKIPLVPTPDSDEGRDALRDPLAWGDVGKRFYLGGQPSLAFSRERPHVACEKCGSTMVHYACLDGVGAEWVLGDVFVMFVFVCYDCFSVRGFVHPR